MRHDPKYAGPLQQFMEFNNKNPESQCFLLPSYILRLKDIPVFSIELEISNSL
jgi:hypothetical protein